MTALQFRDVTVRYGGRRGGLTAVDKVSLTVPSGQTLGLVGESGSGKSTLARAAVGLTEIAGGAVLLGGTAVQDLPQGARPLQMVFQDPHGSLDPRMTIGSSIAEAMPRGTRTDRRARRAEVARLLDLVQLDAGGASSLPGQLSGGQRQRVAFARALAGRPSVVIADEITSALDVSVQGAILNLFRDLQRELNLTLLFISHNLAVTRYVSDHIAVMNLGQIVEYGPTDQVLLDPKHPYTRDLLDAAPTKTIAHRLTAADSVTDTDPPDPHNPPAGCRYHPRCPIGPILHPDRQICLTTDPTVDQHRRPHQAACHLAEPSARDVSFP